MIITSESTKAIGTALLAFQGHVSGVKRDGKNPHFKSRYATLENVFDTARPALQAAGLVVMQAPCAIVEGSLEITTRLIHAESGEWMESTMHMPIGKRDPQGAGSATTYGLRYSLMAMLGLPPTDDDDGNYATLQTQRREDPPPPVYDAPPRRKSGLAQTGYREDGSHTTFKLKNEKSWEEVEPQLHEDLVDCHSLKQLHELKVAYWKIAQERKWNDSYFQPMKEVFGSAEQAIMDQMEAEGDVEGLAEVPLRDALKHSVQRPL